LEERIAAKQTALAFQTELAVLDRELVRAVRRELEVVRLTRSGEVVRELDLAVRAQTRASREERLGIATAPRLHEHGLDGRAEAIGDLARGSATVAEPEIDGSIAKRIPIAARGARGAQGRLSLRQRRELCWKLGLDAAEQALVMPDARLRRERGRCHEERPGPSGATVGLEDEAE